MCGSGMAVAWQWRSDGHGGGTAVVWQLRDSGHGCENGSDMTVARQWRGGGAAVRVAVGLVMGIAVLWQRCGS